MTDNEFKYQETQKFTQWWLWIILLGLILMLLYACFVQLVLGEKFGTKPAPDIVLIIITILILGVNVFFYTLRMETVIVKDTIKLSFFPISTKTEFKINEIHSAEIITYKFLGYGIKFSSKYGNVYNVKGNKGLFIQLISGEKILIGTSNENELEFFLKKYMPNFLNNEK